jgi:hypothetical protein
MTWWERVYTRVKALGFVLLVEGVLLLSPLPALSYVALAVLVTINALGTGAALALADRADSAAVHAEPGEPGVSVSGPLALAAGEPADSAKAGRVDYYTRALEVLRQNTQVSAALLRKHCVMTAADASAMIGRLVAEGLVSAETNPRGQRQVLRRFAA